MPGYKLKFEPVVNRPSRGDRILRHDATIPFYFHLEIVPWQDRPAEIEDVSKAFRLETVIEILGDVSLQDACSVITEDAARRGNRSMDWSTAHRCGARITLSSP